MPIAQNLLNRRETLHLTQEELSEKVGVKQAHLSNIERGFKVPSLELTKRLADALERDGPERMPRILPLRSRVAK